MVVKFSGDVKNLLFHKGLGFFREGLDLARVFDVV